MNEKDVQAIRTLAEIENMKRELRDRCSARDYILFVLGINTGLRCGDLLTFKAEDLAGKREVRLKEHKTGKFRTIYLDGVYNELNAYIKTLPRGSWLFPSRKGDGPITVTQAYRQLNKAAEYAEIEHIGTHTMRKTFAYWLYKQTKNPELVMTHLGHTSWAVTRRYAGLTDDDIREALTGFKL